jgi:RHS repeat-associated protein
MTYTLTGTLEKKSVTWIGAQVKKENASGKSYKYYHFACPPERKRRRGLQTANSWTRENVTGNNFLANGGTELNPTTSLYDLDFRNYDPVLGRMQGVDPMATKYASLTPYNYAFNDPVTFNDVSGADPYTINYSASNSQYYTAYTYDDRVDYNYTAVWHDAQGWRNAEQRAFLGAATGYGSSMFGMGAGWKPGANGIASLNSSWASTYTYEKIGTVEVGGYIADKYGWVVKPAQAQQGGVDPDLSSDARSWQYVPVGPDGHYQTQESGPGRFFTNEGDAYRYMWNSSFDADGKVQQEVAAFLTSKGVLVLPTEGTRTNGEYAKNGPRRSYNDFLPLSRKDGNIFVTFNGASYQVLGQVHTHPNAQPFGRYEVASDLVTQSFLGVPVYMIRTNGFYNTSGTVLGTQQQFFNGTKSLIGGK